MLCLRKLEGDAGQRDIRLALHVQNEAVRTVGPFRRSTSLVPRSDEAPAQDVRPVPPCTLWSQL